MLKCPATVQLTVKPLGMTSSARFLSDGKIRSTRPKGFERVRPCKGAQTRPNTHLATAAQSARPALLAQHFSVL